MIALRSHEELRAFLVVFILAALIIIVVKEKSAKRKRDERLAEPVDSKELRRKRLAMLDPKVCACFLRASGGKNDGAGTAVQLNCCRMISTS